MEHINNAEVLEPDRAENLSQVQISTRPERTSVLSLLNKNLPIIIDQLDVSSAIASKDNLFKEVDKYYYSWHLNNIQPATPVCQALIYGLTGDASLEEAFNSFKINLDSLCLTQSQMAYVCKNKWFWLNSFSRPNFFLIKENGAYYVSAVYFKMRDHMVSLEISYRVKFYEFCNTEIWSQGYLIVKN